MSDKNETEQSIVTSSVSLTGSKKYTIKGQEFQIFVVRPPASSSDHELQIALTRNRKMIEDSAKAMYKLKPGKTKVDDLISPTRNALLARANIDMLIPLINIKGGEAEYTGKNEGVDIVAHVEKLRVDAEKKVAKMTKKDPYENLTLILLVTALTSFIIYFLYNWLNN